ncbi:hypothetical protein AAIH37_34835, partial [Pseudomonas aeruginosa]
AASLAEPMCCIIGAYHANYHTTQYVYEHRMGVKPGGNIALLACAGPMGIGAIDYAINGGIQPARVVVVDIDDKRLAQVQKLLPVELAEPMCCIVGAYHANYHTTQYVYEHRMGVKPGG